MSSPVPVPIPDPELDDDTRKLAAKLNCPLWAAHLIEMCRELCYEISFIEDKLVELESRLANL